MTPSISDICRQHLDFMVWADELLLGAVAEHEPSEIGILNHIYLGELVWFRRVMGEKDCLITDFAAPADIATLRGAWPALHKQWADWAGSVADWAAPSVHKTIRGVVHTMPLWQIVLHLVNHGSYHRGQVSATLRAGGVPPPATDLIAWYRLQRAAY